MNNRPTENPLAGCRQAVGKNLVAGASEREQSDRIEHSEMMLGRFVLLGNWLDLEVEQEWTLHTQVEQEPVPVKFHVVSCDKTRGQFCCQIDQFRSLESQQCLLAAHSILIEGQVDLSMGCGWQSTSAKFDSLNYLRLSSVGWSVLVQLFCGRCPRTYSENAGLNSQPFARLRHLSLQWLRR